MKALITGIGGFVGGYLYQHLHAQGIKVCGTRLPNETVPDFIHPDTDIRVVDLLDREAVGCALKDLMPDAIYHLAAQSSVAYSWKNPAMTFDVNVNGTIHLMEWVRELKLSCRILLIGSSEAYGKVKPEDTPIAENHPCQPENPYAISKMAQEHIGRLYSEAYGLDIIAVRAFNHTGPRQSPTFVIPDFARRLVMMEKGQMAPNLLVGNLEAIRDFSDVRDIVRGYHLLIDKGHKGEVYNIGAGTGCSIHEILDKLMAQASVPAAVQQDPARMRPSDVPVIICNNHKITQHVHWQPEISIDQTLADVLNYWRHAL